MSKEFSVTLTGAQQVDLWAFFYTHGAVKPRDRENGRNLDAVLDAFKVKAVQERIEALVEAGDGASLSAKDFASVTMDVGSVDLKRAIDYLDKLPETLPTALTMRLLALGDMLIDVKDRKPSLEAVPA